MDVFLGLRDLHTNYVLPAAHRTKSAFLPFRVEEFYEPAGLAPANPVRKYAVSWVSPMNSVTSLKEGVVVTRWNGSPIDLAVARNGSREAGSNADARRAQGIESLTLRWFGMSLPPDEDWVTLTYTDGTKTYDARFDWEVVDGLDLDTLLAGLNGATGLQMGLDLNRVLLDRLRELVFDPQAVAVEQEAATLRAAAGAAPPAPPRAETSVFPDVFERFGPVTVPSVGTFGYVRLKSFAPESPDIDGVVREFARILTTLPTTGLILDVRGNGGGFINIGERILQMLTPKEITPEPFHFLATPLTQAIATAAANGWGDWKNTIGQGIESGASFSQGFPLTEPRACNDVGQLYQGPVVLVTNALCYSTTDIFAAGFQDHGIGPVLGCHASTGAGGATVWDHAGQLLPLMIAPANPFERLPKQAGMRVAALRCTRVGTRIGLPVEDYGVVSDPRYYMTKADVVLHNEDLIATAARMLDPLPKQTLRLTPVPAAPASAAGRRVHQHRPARPVGERPAGRVAERDAAVDHRQPAGSGGGEHVEGQGYRKGALVVATRLQL